MNAKVINTSRIQSRREAAIHVHIGMQIKRARGGIAPQMVLQAPQVAVQCLAGEPAGKRLHLHKGALHAASNVDKYTTQ